MFFVFFTELFRNVGGVGKQKKKNKSVYNITTADGTDGGGFFEKISRGVIKHLGRTTHAEYNIYIKKSNLFFRIRRQGYNYTYGRSRALLLLRSMARPSSYRCRAVYKRARAHAQWNAPPIFTVSALANDAPCMETE